MAHEDEFEALEKHLEAGYHLLEEGERLEEALRSLGMPKKSDPVWTPGRWRKKIPFPVDPYGEFLIVEQI